MATATALLDELLLDHLRKLVGRERSMREVCQCLHFIATGISAPTVGALQVICADETEFECVGVFQRKFAHFVLPKLKFAQHAPMRIANLGGRYEWGAIRIAEAHFATPESRDGFKLMVVKINSHTAKRKVEGQVQYGSLDRYQVPSSCCGTLDALMHGRSLPFVNDLRDSFESEGLDRLAALSDSHFAPHIRPLVASIVSARLQARKVIVDIQDYRAISPTVYLVLPCVSLNQDGPDTEIVVGLYVADDRDRKMHVAYEGLGDDPRDYSIEWHKDALVVSDPHTDQCRLARDHREQVLQTWLKRRAGAEVTPEQLKQLKEQFKGADASAYTAIALKSALLMLAETIPIPLAIMLFAHGAVGAHHMYRAYRLSQNQGDPVDAKQIINEMHSRVDDMDSDEIRTQLERLIGAV